MVPPRRKKSIKGTCKRSDLNIGGVRITRSKKNQPSTPVIVDRRDEEEEVEKSEEQVEQESGEKVEEDKKEESGEGSEEGNREGGGGETEGTEVKEGEEKEESETEYSSAKDDEETERKSQRESGTEAKDDEETESERKGEDAEDDEETEARDDEESEGETEEDGTGTALAPYATTDCGTGDSAKAAPDATMSDQVIHPTDIEADNCVIKPRDFYFGQEQYTRVCKMGSRCHVKDTVEMLKRDPDPGVSELFMKHPQFQHIFHMSQERNRKPMGMWMLMLHLVRTDSTDALWSVVNGVPIRYSLREHGLLCGLDCHEYPGNYTFLRDKDRGDFKFVERVFGKRKVKLSEVEDKLKNMSNGLDRKKVAILYFVCKVLKSKSKLDTSIEPFLLKVVDDMKICRKFPWGSYTFDELLAEVRTIPQKFKDGTVKEKQSWTFSGFILPLEAFAFECIPALGRKYRLNVVAEKDCPRLCKTRFVDSSMKGYPLDDINTEIGESKDIISIIKPNSYETELMNRIMTPENDATEDVVDPIVRSWIKALVVRGENIFWEDLYEKDLAARAAKVIPTIRGGGVGECGESSYSMTNSGWLMMVEEIAKSVSVLSDKVDEKFKTIFQKLDDYEVRMVECERFVMDERMKNSANPTSLGFGRYSGSAAKDVGSLDVIAEAVGSKELDEEGRPKKKGKYEKKGKGKK